MVDPSEPEADQILFNSQFFVHAGDADHNRMIDARDLLSMGNNWFGTGKKFSQGDFNYDGTVNQADLTILAQGWQHNLPPSTLGMHFTGTAISTERVNFYWTPVGGAVSYRIDISTDGIDFFDSAFFDTSSEVASGIDFFPDQAFYFRAAALNGGGTQIAVSNTVQVTTLAEPASAPPLPVQLTSRRPNTRTANRVPTRLNVALAPELDEKLLVAFNGAYVDTTLESVGNQWFEKTVQDTGVSMKPVQTNDRSAYRYDLADVKTALGDLLARLDTDHNLVITSTEATNPKIIVMGYSWGAINAANFTTRLKEDNITVTVGAATVAYHLNVDIPVDLLVTLDPVHDGPARAVRWVHSKIETHVQKFINYYQQRGGTSTFDLWLHSNNQPFNPFAKVGQGTFGTFFSGLLKGTTLANNLAPANVTQVNINTLGNRMASNYQWSTNPLNSFVTQYDTDLGGSGIEHLGLPWYVMGGTNPNFDTNYNILLEISNV